MKLWKYRDRSTRRCIPGVSCACSPNDHTCRNRPRGPVSSSPKERRRLSFGGGGYEPTSARRARHNRKQREGAR